MSEQTTSGTREAKRGAPPRAIFFGVFAISGFSGLIYESIWSHYLKLFLGHAAYAQSLVLMIFMGGLALGSWVAARYSERFRTPILAYAVVEGVIGAIALVFHDAFVALSDAFQFSILPAVGSPAIGGLLKWSAAAALIVPQSVLLGMTFPLMSAGIIRRYPEGPGGTLAMLYFTNSIGAAVGVLASGFWLIAAVGLPGTIMTAGLLNVALALGVWMLVKLDPDPTARPAAAATRAPCAGGDSLLTLFLVAAAVTGAASFVYEIAWIRMLSLVLGSTTHSFELMLSAFITGLAFGGLWIKRRIDRIEDTVRFAGWVQVAMGVLAVCTIPLYVRTFDWMAAFLSAIQRTEAGYGLFTLFSHGLALLVMVPTTFLAGMTLPLFTHVLMRRHAGEGAIGRVYAANTLGSIVGVVFAVHVGMPLLGLQSLVTLGAGLDVLLGLVLLYRSGAGRQVVPLVRGAGAGVAALGLVAFTVDLDPRRLASGVYRYRQAEMPPEGQVLLYRDGKTSSISFAVYGSLAVIATNGKPDAAIELNPELPRSSDEITMAMAAALPLAYKADARHAANIGFGSGLTTHTLLAHPALERVDTIEIEPAMVQAARGFGERVARAFADPRSRIHTEDAKTFFSLHNQRYDIIVAEPSNPWVSGVASLFSEEFYRTVPRYLTPDGLFVQWLQLYEFNDALLLSIVKALAQHFSDFAVYNTDNLNILLVASPHGPLPSPRFDRVLTGELGAELARVGLKTEADFLVRKTGTKQVLDALSASSATPANSDYFPFLDLNAGKARFAEERATMFLGWSNEHLPLLEMIGVADFDFRRVMADATFQRTMRIDQARRAYDKLVLGLDSDAPSLEPGLTVVELMARACNGEMPVDDWLDALDGLVRLTVPFLPPDEAAALLDAAVPGSCPESASGRMAIWLDLYRGIATRKADVMAAAGAAALADGAGGVASRQYALLAAMLGHLAGGRPRDVIALWTERPADLVDVTPSPALTLLLGMAERGVASNGWHDRFPAPGTSESIGVSRLE